MKFCSNCGAELEVRIPDGDLLPRHVCNACNSIFYKNPVVVAGCVPFWRGRALLCRRAIEPSFGCWTVPGGFVEIGETAQQAALREASEEANVQVRLGSLLSVTDVINAHQVHLFYKAEMLNDRFAAGSESLEVRLFAPEDIPWDAIAFDSVEQTLRAAVSTSGLGGRFQPLLRCANRPPMPSQYEATACHRPSTVQAA
ncbi:MAG: NUDIX hydrolase [Pseudomonadota bacterium]